MNGREKYKYSILILAFLLGGCLDKNSELAPRIAISPGSIDLGQVEEGIEIKKEFLIENRGKAPLKVFEAKSSCGCTLSDIKDAEIAAGASTTMNVTVDTSMKQGRVTKTLDVSSNDPTTPVLRIPISMTVPNQHDGMSEEGKAKILTDRRCMTCHVDQGVGLGGKDLYEADCAMCHGKDAKGEIGGALIYGDYDNRDYAAHIRNVISYGSKTHRSMPGFLDEAGGPLVKEQVDSLIDYLKELSLKEKSKMKN